jgi:hypothetical protein
MLVSANALTAHSAKQLLLCFCGNPTSCWRKHKQELLHDVVSGVAAVAAAAPLLAVVVTQVMHTSPGNHCF